MTHGMNSSFEIVGEQQIIDGKPVQPAGVGPRFGRIFHEGAPFRPSNQSLEALGQVMTAVANRADGPIPAGYTYFGQFVDHDLTKDNTANMPQDAPEVDANTDILKQGRSPTLDLDSLYGRPDSADPALLDSDGKRMKIGFSCSVSASVPGGPLPHMPNMDVPRDANGVAMIGDPRNDENLIVQQTHLAFLKFHNKVVDLLEQQDPTQSSMAIFARARDLVTRHYQWIIIEDFVRRFVSPATFKAVFGTATLAGKKEVKLDPLIFKVSAAQIPPMPLEFSGAAYRMGHSMVRDTYGWNRIFGPGTPFSLFFRFTQLMGGTGTETRTFPTNWIADWRRMFDFSGVAAFPAIDRTAVPLNFAKQLDIQIALALGNLPKGNGNLAARNLVRGAKYGLRSGQETAALASAAGDTTIKVLTPTEILSGLDSLSEAQVLNFDFHLKTPLWFYILKEAQNGGGQHLGPLGSRIVAETFLAFVRTSRISILTAASNGKHALFDPKDSPLRTPQGGEPITSLPHLLAFVGDINPLGD